MSADPGAQRTFPTRRSSDLITGFAPTSGTAGASVTINGTNFTGVTAVRFNGTSATTFTATSTTAIQATVPTGATTGPLSVKTGTANGWTRTTDVVSLPPPIS